MKIHNRVTGGYAETDEAQAKQLIESGEWERAADLNTDSVQEWFNASPEFHYGPQNEPAKAAPKKATPAKRAPAKAALKE